MTRTAASVAVAGFRMPAEVAPRRTKTTRASEARSTTVAVAVADHVADHVNDHVDVDVNVDGDVNGDGDVNVSATARATDC
jgi:hypothetical protein